MINEYVMSTQIIRPIIILLMSAVSYVSYGQKKMESFLYGTKSIIPGDTLQLVKGSLGGKSYVHVFIDQSKMTSNTRLTSQFDGVYVIIQSLRVEKKNKEEKVIASLLGLEPFKTKCYLKEALDAGELILITKKKF